MTREVAQVLILQYFAATLAGENCLKILKQNIIQYINNNDIHDQSVIVQTAVDIVFFLNMDKPGCVWGD